MIISDFKKSNVLQYFHIAKASCRNAIDYANDVRDILDKGDKQEIRRVGEKIANEASITIVFSTMALESFINEFAIRKKSRSFFNNNLDSLKLKSKFIVFAPLFGNFEFPVDGEINKSLDWLLTRRNDLVHYKIRKVNMEASIDNKDFLYKNHAMKSIYTVVEVIRLFNPNYANNLEDSYYYQIFPDKNIKETKF